MKVPQPRDARGHETSPGFSPVENIERYVRKFMAHEGVLQLRGAEGVYTIVRSDHPSLKHICKAKDNPCVVFYEPDRGTPFYETIPGDYAHPDYGSQLNFQTYVTPNWYTSQGRAIKPTVEAFVAICVSAILNDSEELCRVHCGTMISSK